MTKEEAIKQLKDLLIDSKKFVSIEPTKEDVQAIEIIVGELERTAQEVPVQEQLINLIEGIPLYEWEKFKRCVDREFLSQSNKTIFKLNQSFKSNLNLECGEIKNSLIATTPKHL